MQAHSGSTGNKTLWQMFRAGFRQTVGALIKETLTNTLKSYTKWVFQSACEIIASPDVGNKGAIYIGPWGKMYAITPEEN